MKTLLARASIRRPSVSNGMNASLMHKWRRQADRGNAALAPLRESRVFIPIALASELALSAGDIRIELRRGPVTVNVI